jgi:hypothetical protein
VGGGAGGEGGAAGGSVEGCVDIWVDSRILPPSSSLGGTVYWARQPFWRDDEAVRIAWQVWDGDADQMMLVVSSFEPASGELVGHAVFDAYPANVAGMATHIQDAAGAPDGSFAAIIGHATETDPYGSIRKVAVGNVHEAALATLWTPPWSLAEATLTHVGWDGEAFAVHAKTQGQADLRLVRLAADGTVVTPETQVGTVTSTFTWEESADYQTDAQSGTSWMATSIDGGLWLSGHHRDGTLLPGTEAQGGVLVTAEGTVPTDFPGRWPAAASTGNHALLAWRAAGRDETLAQHVVGTTASGNALVIPNEESSFVPLRRALVHHQDGWRMFVVDSDVGIESLLLSDAEVHSRDVLVPHESCYFSCPPGKKWDLDVRILSAVSWQDELWFGFRDLSDCFSVDWHPDGVCPYRIVRVRDQCVYATAYDSLHGG